MTDVPASHPRHVSLRLRDRMVASVEAGVTSVHGLIAHGRGEAFDYLIGEKTGEFARDAIRASAAMLLAAKHPVISVNGNTAALVPDELIKLSLAINAPLEVNIFHSSKAREQAMRDFLLQRGAGSVLMPDGATSLESIDSNRRFVHAEGIMLADVIFVPLEDGDRCEALVKMGRKVITVDLNPLSRTAKTSTMTIVDNLVRTMPLLIAEIEVLRARTMNELKQIVASYDSAANLRAAERQIREGQSRERDADEA